MSTTGGGRSAGAAAGAVLVLAALLLALPGPGLVPGAAPDEPRWILGLFGDGLGISPGLYLALIYVAVLAWAAFVGFAGELDRRLLWLLIAGLVSLFALAPPLLSLDVFSYISYARIDAAGLNPYETAPIALPGDPAAERVQDFRGAISVYGPLFTLASAPLGTASAGFALWTFKAVAALSVLAIAGLTGRIARLRGLPAAPAACFVALNPLVLIHVVGGAHNDGAMVAVAMAGVLLALSARPRGAGVALAASAALKATGALYAPFALAGAVERRKLVGGLLIGAAVIALAGFVAFGGSVLEAVEVAGGNQERVSAWSVVGALSSLLGTGTDLLRYAFALGYVAAVVALLVWVLRGADWVRAAGWAALGLLVASASMTPWYLIWALPLIAVSRDRALVGLGVAMTLFQAINSIPV